ncbi:MAG TPA: hypothetical protein VIV60_24665, partial [Polyangiaceae bacterium]
AETMGDREQFDDPTSVVTSSNAAEEPKSSRQPSDSQPVESQVNVDSSGMRRSSLRPAPGFKPSARDPSTLRPAMVIHAGDADPSAPVWDLTDPATSHPSLPALEAALLSAATHSEPFSLAEDLRSDPSAVVIPPAAAIPREALEPRDPRNAPPRADTHASRARATDALPATVGPVPEVRDAASDDTELPARGATAAEVADANAHATTQQDTPSKQLNFRRIAAVAAPLLLVGVVAVTLLGRAQEGSNDSARAALGADSLSSPTPASEQQPTLPRAEPAAQASPESAVPASAAPAPIPPTDTTLTGSRDQAPSNAVRATHATGSGRQVANGVANATPTPNAARVTLEVKPVDAKVFLRGVAVAGPPYVFDVRKGERITVEVIRFGFVTRKVTITDKRPLLSVGMVRNRSIELTH